MENLIDERFCKCYGKHRLELSCAQCQRKVNIFQKICEFKNYKEQ